MSIMPVYLGLNGMSIAVTEFYYTHLSQSNICNRLISLCVSDTLAINNGLWLASHLSAFINLRHLSLIDIKRSSFELILDSLSPINSLIMFSVRFSTYCRSVYTFIGVPEGAYYERIFHLFPSLRICQLFFWRYIQSTLDSQFVLPPDRAFVPIQTSLLNLQSLVLRDCSPSFLSYLFEHLPQLEQLSYARSAPWLPQEHPLRYGDNNRVTPINRRLAPNLCRLNISWNECIVTVKSINQLFERDVLFSLIKFTLSAKMAGPHVLHNLLPMFSSQCLISFDVWWCVTTVVSLSEVSNILSDTFQQLKGSVSIELELSLEENMYSIRAVTAPRRDKYLCVYSYLHNTVHGRSRWPYNRRAFNSQLFRCNRITMSDYYDKINDEFLSLSPSIVAWNQITSLNIAQPFNSIHLYFLFSQTTNLRTLELHYRSEYDDKRYLKEETLIDLLDDTSLCNMLMSNALRQLNLSPASKQPNLVNIAYLIVERLRHLQVIELQDINWQVTEMSHILINGLSKLNFLTISGECNCGQLYEKQLRDLQNSNTRSFRTEVPNTIDEDTLFVWL
ncbi:unnamed protein product [Rotaria sp. Silwood2]|nr:unnamed protein product [Rotaria sp. Silwood2]